MHMGLEVFKGLKIRGEDDCVGASINQKRYGVWMSSQRREESNKCKHWIACAIPKCQYILTPSLDLIIFYWIGKEGNVNGNTSEVHVQQ